MARKFRFRLATVLMIRQRAQDAQRRTVAVRVERVSMIENRMTELRRQIEETTAGRRTAQNADEFAVDMLRKQHSHRIWLDRRLLESHEEWVAERGRLQQEQHKLAQAATGLRVIEKLRERKWERYCVAVSREEQAESDEAGLRIAVRNRRLGPVEMDA